MSGRVDLSPKQAEKLKQFRQRVSDVLTKDQDDHYVLRWLRARSFDLDKSEKMLRDHIAYRKEWDIDHIMSKWEAPEVLEKYMIGGLFGEDKAGRPVYYEAFGTVDCKGIIYSCNKEDFVRYKLRLSEAIYERFQEQTKKHGRRIDNLTMILDFDQVGLSHLWMPFLNVYCDVLCQFEANYPETLHRCFVVNAPSMVSVGFNIIKPFLSADTRKKIKFFGGNYKGKLLEAIDPDQLPMHYGGTAVDNGDPKCSAQIRYGGKVPQSYYLKEKELHLSGSSNLKQETVASNAKLQVPLEVTVPGSALRWEFHTEKDDISFGVYCKPSGSSSELIAILPSTRFTSPRVPECGIVECKEIGTYVVIFDNTFSCAKSKKLFYSVDILPPDDSTEMAANSME